MAADVKERLLDTVDEAKQFARRMLEDFKEQTPFFKARVGVLAGYLVIAVATIWAVPPPGEDNNALKALIKVDKVSFGSREKTFIEITNNSKIRWEDARITITGSIVRNGKPLSGTWTTSERFKPGDKKQFFPEQFKDKGGLRPELDVVVETVTIEAESEKVTKNMLIKKPAG